MPKSTSPLRPSFFARAERAAKHTLRRLMQLGRMHSCYMQTTFGRMHYYDSRRDTNGRVAFFIHGLGASSLSLLPLAVMVRAHCRVIVPDIMHFGGLSEPEGDRLSPEEHILVLEEFVRALRLPPMDLFGHSIGGNAVIRLAARYPSLVRSIALVNPGGFSFGFEQVKADLLQIHDGSAETIYEQIIAPVPFLRIPPVRAIGSRVVESALGSQAIRDLFESIGEKDFADPFASKVRCPTLLLWGDQDRFLPIETARYLASELRESEAYFVEGGSHLLAIDAPYQVYSMLRPFLGYGQAPQLPYQRWIPRFARRPSTMPVPPR